VIDEVPIDSLIWVDRKLHAGERCEDVGRTLADLGAISHSQALRFLGTDTIVWFEGGIDRRVFTALMRRLGMDSLLARCRLEILGGHGDSSHLAGSLRLLKKLRPMRARLVMFKDADYAGFDETRPPETEGDVMTLRLPCKELENLLLLNPDAIANAAQAEAERRAAFTGKPPRWPSTDEVEAEIVRLTQAPDLMNQVRVQWMTQNLSFTTGGTLDPGQFKRAEDNFQGLWKGSQWRRRWCPGKRVLADVREWLQGAPFGLTLGIDAMFVAYEPTPELRRLFDALERFVNEESSAAR
jgi:hypothetical protein